MSAGDLGDDGEAEAGARVTLTSTSPESLEDMGPVGRGDTWPLI